jgi:hypothetical protein
MFGARREDTTMPCEMMAIGDSLFNGVRSLTIERSMADWSAPAQVARALGIPFATPDYQRNVVINLESWAGAFPLNLPLILLDIDSNIEFWTAPPPSAHQEFDNIAIASSTYGQLSHWTWASANAAATSLLAQIKQNQASKLASLASLFFYFNSRFLLNPTGDPARKAESPFDVVRRRLPKRLLISIGANNGLWNMAFSAEACPGLWADDSAPFGPSDEAEYLEFVQQVLSLPPEVQHIYILALPLAGTPGALMPLPDDALDHKPGPNAFYDLYENRMGFTYSTLTGAQVAQNVGVVRQLNADLAQRCQGDPRVHIVPIDQVFERFNFKTDANAAFVPVTPDMDLSNLMIDNLPQVDGDGQPFDLWSGGLMGLDGMHPTIVGYNIMARTILESIRDNEGVDGTGALASINDAFHADSLLRAFPIPWHDIMITWRSIRRAFLPAHPVVDAHSSTIEQMMSFAIPPDYRSTMARRQHKAAQSLFARPSASAPAN